MDDALLLRTGQRQRVQSARYPRGVARVHKAARVPQLVQRASRVHGDGRTVYGVCLLMDAR